MKSDEHFYKKLEELTPKIEGEMIQNLYFFFKTFELIEEECEGMDNGVLIPSLDNVWDMQKGLEKMFKDRNEVFVKHNLYEKPTIKQP